MGRSRTLHLAAPALTQEVVQNQPAPTEDTGWITEVTCDPPVEGQYLWIEVPGKDKVMSMCGVEVTGSELDDGPAESYKYICADKRLNSN
jgi:hypothetical protein